MRVVACLGLLALCLGPVGCSSFGKKTSLPKPGTGDRSSPSAARDDHLPPPQPPTTPADTGDAGGIVAGRVVDNFNRTPRSDIWVVAPADGRGAPIIHQAETDPQGYFTILHLRPGQPYRLVARTKEGDFTQAGEVTVRPPNARVIIPVSQDRTPAIPGGGNKEPRPSVGPPMPLPPSGTPGRDPKIDFDIKPPVPLPGPGSGSATPIIRPESIADDPKRPRDVKIDMPHAPPPRFPPAPPPLPKPAPAPRPPDNGPALPEPPLSPVSVTQLPLCDKRGNQVYNFALADLDGQPWEYRRTRRPGTRLTLIDFWGTWCAPCRAAVKNHLVPLNDLYGRQGLEVVGIAYENETTFAGQVQTVRAAVRDLRINYRVLMGYGSNCPVRRDFGVKGFPTLILLNDRGQEIWRSEGLTDAQFLQLKAEIRKELGIQ